MIVGDGIAARSICYFLTKKYPKAAIGQIADDISYPSCSLKTTSVVSLGLFEEGISKLGDILFNAHIFFNDFVKKNNPNGIYPAKQYYLPPNIKEDPLKFKQFEARYGSHFVDFKGNQCVAKDAFLINPSDFMDWLKSHYSNEIEFMNGRVSNVSCGLLQTSLGELRANKIILATSAYTSLFFKDKSLPEGKPVKGTYYFWDNIDFDEDFVLSHGHYNLIYRRNDKRLLFGANSIEGLNHLHTTNEVEEEFEFFKTLIPQLKSFGVPSVETGIRHKGKRRTPFMGEVSEGIYALNALYKNGWSAGISLAKDLVELL